MLNSIAKEVDNQRLHQIHDNEWKLVHPFVAHSYSIKKMIGGKEVVVKTVAMGKGRK